MKIKKNGTREMGRWLWLNPTFALEVTYLCQPPFPFWRLYNISEQCYSWGPSIQAHKHLNLKFQTQNMFVFQAGKMEEPWDYGDFHPDLKDSLEGQEICGKPRSKGSPREEATWNYETEAKKKKIRDARSTGCLAQKPEGSKQSQPRWEAM